MLLQTYYNGIEIHRKHKVIFVKFVMPHRVLSTCQAAGGLRDGLQYVYNHQSCEPAGHTKGLPGSVFDDPRAYRRFISNIHGLPAEGVATLGTAANMHNAAIVAETFRDLEVVSISTGSVKTNAGRAGDTASYYEGEHGFEYVGDADDSLGPGTINTMIFINKDLTPGTMVRAVMTATEAKVALLQELAVNSRYSDGLATGTGTDQISIAAMSNTGKPLTSAGKHCKLGELIGKSVSLSLRKTFVMQNDLTPERQCSVRVHLERFGTTEDIMKAEISQWLTGETKELFLKNFVSLDRDPVVVAAVAAMVHLKDKITWGILPSECRPEILGTYLAQLAAAVSGKYDKIAAYREQFAPQHSQNGNGAFLHLVYRAIAVGFSEKWIEYGEENV